MKAGKLLFSSPVLFVLISNIAITSIPDRGAQPRRAAGKRFRKISTLIDTELSSLGLDGVALSAAEKTDRNQMTAALYEQLKTVSGVKDSTPVVMDSGAYELGAKTGNAFFWGIAPKAENIVTLELLHGRMIGSEEVLGARKVCIVDEKIAQDAYQRTNIVGKTIRLTINGVTDGYTVIGVVKAGSSLLNGLTGSVMPNFVYLPYSTLSFFSADSSTTG